MKKIPISTIALVAIAAIISGLVSATAATKLFNANEVGYASNRTNINATDVQGAIDELYAKATDYQGVASSIANLTSSVNMLTNKVGNLEKPTWVELNQKGSLSGSGGYIDFHFNGSSSDYTSRIIERNSGELSLFAPNGVKINSDTVVTSSVLDALDIGGMTAWPTNGIQLYNCTGSILSGSSFKYKIVGKHIVMTGRIVLQVDTKTGSNPGVLATLPESKTIRGSISSIYVAPCLSLTGDRHGEVTSIMSSDVNNKIKVVSTETFTNVAAGSKIVFYIPMTIIPIN